MKSTSTLLVAMLAAALAFGQNLASDHNGSSSIISTAGSGVDGASGLTLAGWVYPRDPVGGWPNFDGFFGFRNEFDFDFYLLQLNATNIEGRFRNHLGTPYTTTSTSLVVNEWQHIALTYDGTTLRIYHNGNLDGSIAATGNVTSAGESFHIGMLPFGITPFHLDGQTDNVQLWSRALSAAEISDLGCREALDPGTHPDLAAPVPAQRRSRRYVGRRCDRRLQRHRVGRRHLAGQRSDRLRFRSGLFIGQRADEPRPHGRGHQGGPDLGPDRAIGRLPDQRGTAGAGRSEPQSQHPGLPSRGTFDVPYAAAGAGTTWQWQVRCACSISPIDATPFSAPDTFSTPLLRTGSTDFASVYPNPTERSCDPRSRGRRDRGGPCRCARSGRSRGAFGRCAGRRYAAGDRPRGPCLRGSTSCNCRTESPYPCGSRTERYLYSRVGASSLPRLEGCCLIQSRIVSSRLVCIAELEHPRQHRQAGAVALPPALRHRA